MVPRGGALSGHRQRLRFHGGHVSDPAHLRARTFDGLSSRGAFTVFVLRSDRAGLFGTEGNRPGLSVRVASGGFASLCAASR